MNRDTTIVTRAGSWLLTASLALGTLQTAVGACDAPEFRQFDFWIGHWRVENSDGEVVGHNRIEPVLEGCALRESWTGRAGVTGHSLNAYDAQTGRWQQTWVDSRGTILNLQGEFDGEAMVLEGERRVDGEALADRITWSVADEGRVIQRWEQAGPDGEFNTVFEGHYIRMESPAPED